MAKFTISMIKMANEMAGGHFFEKAKMKARGETLASFKVVHGRDNRIFIEYKRMQLGKTYPRWEFDPSNGKITLDSMIQN